MTIYYNDIDPYCCKVLQKNIERGFLPEGTIDGRDIRTVSADELMGYTHIHLFAGIGGFPLGMARAGYPLSLRTITGGFPCQDISLAGRGIGITGERSGLWKEMYRLACDLRPDYLIIENVAALLNRGMGTVLADLAACGYDAEWQSLPASAFGAPHHRDRTFILAYPGSQRVQRRWTQKIQRVPAFSWCQDVRSIEDLRARPDLPSSLFRGASDGLPNWVHRLRGLGNSIVPQIAEYVARSIMAYEMEREAAA